MADQVERTSAAYDRNVACPARRFATETASPRSSLWRTPSTATPPTGRRQSSGLTDAPLPRLAPHLARRGPEAEQVEVLVPRSNSRPHTEMRAAESARWRTVRTPCSLCGQTNMDLDAPANTPGIGRTSEP